MEEKKESNELYKSFAKEGFLHLMLDKDGKKMVLYIEHDLPLYGAFEGAFDFAQYLRDMFRKEIQKNVKEAQEDKKEDS